MSLVRINQFDALPGRRDTLRETLATLLPSIRDAAGCLSVRLLESEDTPGRFVIVEEWATRADHGMAASRIPTDVLHKTMTMLADLPSGGFFIEHG